MYLLKKIIFILSILSYFNGYCQLKITGIIIDSDNNIKLPSVKITNVKTETTVTSNQKGYFQLTESGTYSFKKVGYISKLVSLKMGSNYVIQLNLNPNQINEVVIFGNHIPKKLKKSTASISIISSKEIEYSNNLNPVSILNKTPGVFMQTGALNTNRITIRGIGSRNLYGTSKIRAYFKDIPLTNGSGETNIEDFELGAISRLEIIKGAVSSTFGAGLGGTINLIPKQGVFNKQAINNEFLLGSFGLVKSLTSLNLSSKFNSYKMVYSNTHSDGYRENNKYNRQTFTLSSSHFFKKKDELVFLTSFVNLKAFIPSSINKTNFVNNPKSAAFTWKEAMGFEDSKRGVLGLSWHHQFNTNIKQVTSIFTSFRKSYEPRPFNILSETTLAIGIRSRLVGNGKLFDKTINWTAGGELFRDTLKSETFENLYEEYPPNTGSIKGNQLSNFKEKRNYYNMFFETNYDILDKTTLSIGINLNKTSYTLKDRFPIEENNPDQSGSFKYKTIASPKFGISQSLTKHLNIFTSISHGFSPISLNETLLPDGQINTNLNPETGWNFEVGSRGTAFDNKLQFSISIYRLNIKNLLVARRTSEDQFIGVNAGKTQHDGIEVALNSPLISKKNFKINCSTNLTLNNYKFKEFIDGENDFSGNNLTGVPSKVFNAIIDINSNSGIYGNLNFQYVGKIPITDSNTLYSDSYNLTNCKIGFKKNLNKSLKMNIFIGLNNIFDTHYASQILINATSFNDSAPRYYYPGNPVNYYSGINFNYTF
ncbi:TonB-dependent receptor [Seonamhaeicola sp. NFXS20]|uniref:TonB-dependent receptor domain-containing protein n=1 Tax=Seonamhaeicola sp. NFXS20 TaxID=2816959 RepID=UPI003B8B5469